MSQDLTIKELCKILTEKLDKKVDEIVELSDIYNESEDIFKDVFTLAKATNIFAEISPFMEFMRLGNKLEEVFRKSQEQCIEQLTKNKEILETRLKQNIAEFSEQSKNCDKCN